MYLGYSVDRTDSYFSNTSSEGLANFQQENGLDATGDCNKKHGIYWLKKYY